MRALEFITEETSKPEFSALTPDIQKLISQVPSYHMEDWTQNAGLPEDIVAKYWKLGNDQRNVPERAMLQAQTALGGGVLSPTIEHIGDLTNRMTPKHSLGFAYESTIEKAQKYLASLKSGYGFRREHDQNIKSNANYNKVPYEEYKANVDAALLNYANAHRALAVYNPLQQLARDTAVALGEQRFEDAAKLLDEFVIRIPTKEAFVEEMKKFKGYNKLRESEIINERASSVVYHYTSFIPARNILSTGNFELTSAVGSLEQQYAPKGYPYFLSTTRTRHGGYHTNSLGRHGVLFVLDGEWYNRHYKAASVDYYQDRNPRNTAATGRNSEAEDRIFSKEPTMSIGGVKEIHVLVSEGTTPVADSVKARARQILILAKKQNIPAYFYTDATAWLNFDKRNLGDVSLLTGKEDMNKMNLANRSTHKGYLYPWIELIFSRDKEQLSNKANELRYSVVNDNPYYIKDIIRGLSANMSNARKPNSGIDREHTVKIIRFMQQNKLTTLTELVNAIADKWKAKQK